MRFTHVVPVSLALMLSGSLPCQPPTHASTGPSAGWYDVTAVGPWLPVGVLPANPSDGADDSVAINACIKWVASLGIHEPGGGWKTVYIPPGYYNIGDAAKPDAKLLLGHVDGQDVDRVTIAGAGEITVLKMYQVTATPRPCIEFLSNPNTAVVGPVFAYVKLRDFQIVASEWPGSIPPYWKSLSPIAAGVWVRNTHRLAIENVLAVGMGCGFYMTNGNAGGSFTHLEAHACRYGLMVTSDGNVGMTPGSMQSWEWQTEHQFVNCRFQGLSTTDASLKMDVGVALVGYAVGDQSFDHCYCRGCILGVQMARTASPHPAGSYYTKTVTFNHYVGDWNDDWAISADGFSEIKVDAAYVGVNGIRLVDCDDVVISHSSFLGSWDGVGWQVTRGNAFVDAQRCARLKVQGCHFNSVPGGVSLYGSHHCVVNGNTFEGVQGHSVLMLAEGSNACEFNSVTANTFAGGFGEGATTSWIYEDLSGLTRRNVYWGNNRSGSYVYAQPHLATTVLPPADVSRYEPVLPW